MNLHLLSRRALELVRSASNQAAQPRSSDYCPVPTSQKQAVFLGLDCEEAFFGGAAGGGKSVGLLKAAMGDDKDPYRFVRTPGYSALLLRRTYPDLALPGALMDMAQQWFNGTDAQWKAGDRTWLFPSGARIVFGHLDNENDKYRYQGSQWCFVGFDELTQFTQPQYQYLFSRLRKPLGVDVPLRMRSASNPGGVGHDWVKAHFVEPGSPDRPFIPSRMTDNPGLDVEAYAAMMARLDPVTRKQLEEGDWDILAEGNMFKRAWWRYISRADLPTNLTWCQYFDLAASAEDVSDDPDYTAGALMGYATNGDCFIASTVEERLSPRDTETMIRGKCVIAREVYGLHEVYIEREPGAAGKIVLDHYQRNVLPEFAVREGQTKGKNKIERAKPYSAAVERGNVYLVVDSWNGRFVDMHSVFPNPDFHDDLVDAGSGCYGVLATAPQLTFY